MILAGDFNAEPDGEEFAVMRERKDYVNYTEGIGVTYHGFEPEDEQERIDYIYIREAKEGYPGAYLYQRKEMDRPGRRSLAFRSLSDLRGTGVDKSIKNNGHFLQRRFVHWCKKKCPL